MMHELVQLVKRQKDLFCAKKLISPTLSYETACHCTWHELRGSFGWPRLSS